MTIPELREAKERLIQKKKEIELCLVELRNKFSTNGRMMGHQYRDLCQEQQTKQRELVQIEQALSSMKVKMMAASDAVWQANRELAQTRRDAGDVLDNADEPKRSAQDDKLGTAIRALVSLREQYQQFAADGTRISSKRQMASEFVIELNPIIKAALAK